MRFTVRDGWISGAIKKPVQSKGRRRLTNHNRVNLHIAVANGSSLFYSFDELDEVDSHTYVRHGTAAQIADPKGMADFEQYVSLDYCAFADLDGNDGGFSIETAGGVGSDANVGKWDAAQIRRIIWLWNGLKRTYDIPNKLATSSRLNSIESKGLGWHRIGIDGNFPVGLHGGRLQRGADSTIDPDYMHYSRHWGKSCPGPSRIDQIHGIFTKANLVDFTDDDVPNIPTPKPVLKSRKPNKLPTIKSGSRGEFVVHWQRLLKADNYRVAVDGIFYKDTKQKTRWWQDAKNLEPVDGIVGPITWSESLIALGYLNNGDLNAAVGIWQNIIGVRDDYSFGPITEAATREVQRYLKVADDGVVGPRTTGALLNWWT